MPIEWILFDLNGTLLDPATIDRALGAEDGIAAPALDEAVKHAMALTLVGSYRPFAEVLEAALARALRLAGKNERRLSDAVAAAGRLEPFPGVGDALEELRAIGLRLAVLTNSAGSAADENLTAVGLRGRFEHVVGTDEVRAFKPDPRVYRHALDQIGTAPEVACLVSAHGWDVLGAARAGLRTGWVADEETILMSTVPEPYVMGEDLPSIAKVLRAAGASRPEWRRDESGR